MMGVREDRGWFGAVLGLLRKDEEKRLEKVLSTLTFREREVIKLTFGVGTGYIYDFVECARIFKVTRERMRQIQAKALRKLRHPERVRALGDLAPEEECGS